MAQSQALPPENQFHLFVSPFCTSPVMHINKQALNINEDDS
jgi:hypothetical protein